MADSYLYQYLVGGAVFGVGIWCGLRTGQLSFSAGPERRRLMGLIAGLMLFAMVQGAFVLFGK